MHSSLFRDVTVHTFSSEVFRLAVKFMVKVRRYTSCRGLSGLFSTSSSKGKRHVHGRTCQMAVWPRRCLTSVFSEVRGSSPNSRSRAQSRSRAVAAARRTSCEETRRNVYNSLACQFRAPWSHWHSHSTCPDRYRDGCFQKPIHASRFPSPPVNHVRCLCSTMVVFDYGSIRTGFI